MTAVIERLQSTLGDQSFQLDDPNPLNKAFSQQIQALGPDFYKKIVPSHLVLNMEYSLLGQQILRNIASQEIEKKNQIIEQISAALLLAEILENTYKKYLIVPREVRRLREQQQLYRDVLAEIQNVVFDAANDDPVVVGLSFSNELRTRTIAVNLYRLLFLRGKRALDLIAMKDFSADWYRRMIMNLDNCTDPAIPHLGWLFYLPRLLVNLYLMGLHVIPGSWMEQAERDLGWQLRFQAQLQRRWFELANDIAWVGVGVVNCFIFVGALTPLATYLAIAFFAYDVVVSVIRAYIELNRLYELRKQYQDIPLTAANKAEIEDHLKALDEQIKFETLRLGSHVLSTLGIFLAMCCAAPIFALNPVIPLVGALCLVIICLINFALVPILNHKRPKDIIDAPSGVAELGIFGKPKKRPVASLPVLDNNLEEDEEPGGFCCSY